MPNPYRDPATGRMTTADNPNGVVTPVTRPAEPRPGVTLDVLLRRALGRSEPTEPPRPPAPTPTPPPAPRATPTPSDLLRIIVTGQTPTEKGPHA